MELNKIYNEDYMATMKRMPDKYINCLVTSPPYFGLRDYKEDGQIGLEKTPEEYVQKFIDMFREVWRVLKDDGTIWLNLGDSYNSIAGTGRAGANSKTGNTKKQIQSGRNELLNNLKPKDLIGIPWRVAFALQQDGWYLRQDIIWHKPNPMPESVTDRCTKSHEYIFLLSKSQKYYFDSEAIKEKATGYDGRKDTKMKGSNKYQQSVVPGKKAHSFAANGHERWKFKNLQDKGQHTHSMHENIVNGEEYLSPVRNKRSVWTVNTKPFKEAHFAVFPEKLIEPCVLAGCPENGIVYDPFLGSGTTAVVAYRTNRRFIGSELNKEYTGIANKRLKPYITQPYLF